MTRQAPAIIGAGFINVVRHLNFFQSHARSGGAHFVGSPYSPPTYCYQVEIIIYTAIFFYKYDVYCSYFC